ESGVSLKPYNTFGLPAVAQTLVRIASDADVRRVVDHPTHGLAPKFILGGGSNIVLTRDMPQLVLKIEVMGRRLVEERADAWILASRRAKLPDPAQIGNAGSFFKNPIVTLEQCRDIIGRDPAVVHYPMPDGSVKLAAGWLIDACGWKGKAVGQAAVYEKQALVLVNRGAAIGSEVMTLARAIQESVYGRFGIRLEPEPVVV